MLLLLLSAIGLVWADEPVPDAATLMKEVRAHQQKMDEIRENYTFHRIREVDELDGKGAVRKTHSAEREVFYVNGRQIARLVKKDGVPLTGEEDRKEQERVHKLTVEYSKKPPAFGRGGGVNLIQMVLDVSEVSNPRREDRTGRPTLVFDFKGDPEAQAHSMGEKAARKIEGKVWIDEADRQVARLEVEFYDNFRVAGGLLASIQKGTVFKIEQSPIGEGLWMQTSSEEHMNVRVIVKTMHENTRVKQFDFKRFNAEAIEVEKKP